MRVCTCMRVARARFNKNNNNNARRGAQPEGGGKGRGGWEGLKRGVQGMETVRYKERRGNLGTHWPGTVFPLGVLRGKGGGEKKLRKLFREVFTVRTLIFNQKRAILNTYITSGKVSWYKEVPNVLRNANDKRLIIRITFTRNEIFKKFQIF